MSYEDSVSTWLTLLSDGDERAIETAFDRYFNKLTRLATSKMTGLSQAARSGEDVALSTFRSFCSGVKAGRLVVVDEQDLWASLFCIATRKVYSERRREAAAKRGGNLTRIDSVQINESGEEEDLLANVAGREPSPELAFEMASYAEEVLRIFGQDPKRRQIVELKLLGADVEEIAQKTGLSKRTVNWHLTKIRARLEFIMSAELLFDELFSNSTFEDSAERSGWTVAQAERVVEAAFELWRQESDYVPNFLAKSRARRAGYTYDSEEKTLDAWKSRLREVWTDRLFETFASSADADKR